MIAWVIGNVVDGIPSEYTDKQGNNVLTLSDLILIIVEDINDRSYNIKL